ncbi:CASH domain-dontaining protein, partial [Candidatus Methanophagaceae archaeon]
MNVQSAITIEAWINTTQTTDTIFIQKYDQGSPYNGFGWRMNHAPSPFDGRLCFWNGHSQGAPFYWHNETTQSVNDGKWHHIAVTGAGSTGTYYIDGNQDSTFTFSAIPDHASEVLYIGAYEGTGFWFNGSLDEVAIYNRSLSEDEILNHYRLGEGKYYWKANASDGVLSNESEVREFNVADQTAPSIQLNYPDDKANLSSSTVNFNWTATDNIDDVLLCNLTIDGVVNQSDIASTSGQPTNYSVSGISTGVHNWSVTCRDDAPNVNTSETRTFGVNNSAPNVTLDSPPNGSSTPNSWAMLNATETDADDDPMTVYFYVNNNSNGLNASEGLVYIGENVANGTTLTYNLTALPIKPSEANLSLLMHFDNRSGYGENSTHVYDFSRNGNNGTVNGNPIYNISGGKFAGAYEFDGTEDYVDCGNDPGLPENTPFTVSAWVKLNSLDQGEWKVVTNKLGTDKYVTLTIFLSPANEFSFTTANGTTMNPLSDLKTAPVSATNQWYHVVSTWNGTTKCIYLDGDLSNSTNPESSYEPGAGTGNFSIGARVDGTYCLDGVIDEVAIYNRSLSAEEILNHYRLGEGKYYWKVNASDGVLSNESDVWQFTVGVPATLTCTCGDICVNGTGWWRNNGTFNASSTRIQHAIDNATAGDSIYVYNGSYSENVNVTKQLSLQGEGPDVVNVTNSTAEHHVFNVTANYVNISGFNVTGATGNMKAGIYIGNDVDHCNISGNIVSDNYIGIYLNSSSSNNLFANNTISDNIWD